MPPKNSEEDVVLVHARQVGDQTFLVDLETGGFKELIASYIVKGKKAAIVDCGPASSVDNLISGLEELNVAPEDVTYIALTHVHADHSGSTGSLLKKLPNAQVIVHRRGVPHLIEPTKLWQATQQTLGFVADIFGEPQPVPQDRIVVASESMALDLGGGVSLKVIEAPGHAAHNLCYFNSSSSGLFPGDSAGAYLSQFDVVLPTSPPPFRPDVALITLDKLIALNPKVLFYPHFGVSHKATEQLRNYIAQIKTWLRIAEEAVKEGQDLETLRGRLFSEDETVPEPLRKPLLSALQANAVHRKTLLGNSVQGFWEFAQNPQI